MKTAEELATKHAISKNYIGYGANGFMCQIHYPELCKIIDERDKEWEENYEGILAEVSKVYCELTNNKLSKPNYEAVVILDEVRITQQEDIDEAVSVNNQEWTQKIQTALDKTSNFNCKEVLTKLLEDE